MVSIQEFERTYDVRLINKKDSKFMKAVGWVLKPFIPNFMTDFFTTVRLPFQKGTIYYPDGLDPMQHLGILDHELMHVDQQRTTWGLIKSAFLVSVFPLPVFFSGRWFIEREPYLNDIKSGRASVDWVIEILWHSYGWCWPKFMMKKWFESRLDG